MPLSPAAATIAALPPEVCAEVCAALASSEEGGIDDLKFASLAAKLLREPAARAVTRLLDRDGSLPASAWSRFPEARGLVVRLEEGLDDDALERLPGQLAQLAARLPQRLERVAFERVPFLYSNADLKLSGAFVLGLVAGPCAGSLREVALRPYVSPATAQVLLSKLPRLQRLDLHLYVYDQGTMELSSYPASLLDLELSCRGRCFIGAAALVASPCAGSLTRLSLVADITVPDIDVLLRGLPALEQLALEGCMRISQEPGEPARLSFFPATLQQLELHSRLSYRGSFILDAAALAACCPQLRDVRLHLEEHSQLCNIGSISSWAALESLELDLEDLRHDLLAQAVAAASQLPQLQQLQLYRLEVSTSSQLWAQLASMPALRSLELHRLRVDSVAVPCASIRRLTAALHLQQLPAEQLDGSLAVLLTGLEQLESELGRVTGAATIAQAMSALRSHPMLQQLSLSGIDSRAAQPWGQQQPLRSMPRLRVLSLSQVQPGLLGALLEDASGCAQLQELQLEIGGGAAQATGRIAGSSCGPGLAALARGPCRHSLRSIKVQFLVHHKEDTEHIPVPAHAAPLLQQGALPALRELQLDVLVHAGSLLHGSGSRRSERLRQQARRGAPAWRAPPGSTEQRLQLLERELQQAGVQAVGRLRHMRRSGFEPPPRPTYFEGCIHRCKFSGALWVQW
jgi:hypothetical protein